MESKLLNRRAGQLGVEQQLSERSGMDATIVILVIFVQILMVFFSLYGLPLLDSQGLAGDSSRDVSGPQADATSSVILGG